MKRKHLFIDDVVDVFYNEIIFPANLYAVQNEYYFDRYFCTVKNIDRNELLDINTANISVTTSLFNCKNNLKGTRHKMSGSFLFISNFC